MDFRAAVDGVVDQLDEIVAGGGGGERAELRLVRRRIACGVRAALLDELLEERVVHRVQDDEALGRGAGLPAVGEATDRGCGGCRVEVGVVEHDERVGSTELQHVLLHMPPGDLADR